MCFLLQVRKRLSSCLTLNKNWNRWKLNWRDFSKRCGFNNFIILRKVTSTIHHSFSDVKYVFMFILLFCTLNLILCNVFLYLLYYGGKKCPDFPDFFCFFIQAICHQCILWKDLLKVKVLQFCLFFLYALCGDNEGETLNTCINIHYI